MTARHTATLAGSLALLMLFVGAPAAQAETTVVDVDEIVTYALDAVPGGHATGEHTAYWPDLGMTLLSEEASASPSRDRQRAVGSCASGNVCAYSGSSLSGSKLSWSSCGTHSTAALGSVRSIANGRTSETLRARNGSTVLATATPGTQKNVSGTARTVNC
ncbi:hypothetical protein C5B85_18285 [Pseudoclavibacter sp. AY1F1]|uniref:peptidase inhibitor family I36 protein n=1 Tax=Pseudoclavibacter sp. AY1F1 TaxID=2080583 RepID=UPI000CE8228B|nr:peptidase inhibitor family I36 protein [Pseudoclavibacter sp. AY1F1]PPF41870.1 hypothetical protein C5B85_18285 [Pseudoclavibacter sp. AY1F1]